MNFKRTKASIHFGKHREPGSNVVEPGELDKLKVSSHKIEAVSDIDYKCA